MQKSRKQIYYIKKRFLRNKPAVFGLVIVILAHVISLLGYSIMPDDTPSADNGAVEIQKELPGFEVKILKSYNNPEEGGRNFFYAMFAGQTSPYVYVPINNYKIEGWEVVYEPYDSKGEEKREHLIRFVEALYVGQTNAIDEHENKYKEKGDIITFIDWEGKVRTYKYEALVAKFKENCIDDQKHWLGTDTSGRDILSRLLFGTRISLGIGFVSVLIALVLGISLGGISGYYGGRVDKFIMWIMTVVWSIPGVMLVIAITMALQSKGIWTAFVAVGLTTWVDIARVVRGQIMSTKKSTFVEAARALGFGDMRIIFKHIMPNLLGPIIVIVTANFASAILIESGLSFLGLGVKPPMPSWGMMIKEGFDAFGSQKSWHLMVFPAVCICTLVLAFNLLGNGLRDAIDPRQKVKI